MIVLRLIMCRNCVRALVSISPKMSEHLRIRFSKAVQKDMSLSLAEEPIMVNLLAYEIDAESLKTTIDSLLIEELMHMVFDEHTHTPVFDNEAEIEKWT